MYIGKEKEKKLLDNYGMNIDGEDVYQRGTSWGKRRLFF